MLSGKVVLLDTMQIILLGSRTKLHFEKNAKIKLSNTKEQIAYYKHLPKPFPAASKLGHRAYWNFTNMHQYQYTQVKLRQNSELILCSNTTICPGAYISVAEGKTLTIKTNVYISPGVSIITTHGLTIGKNVLMGHNVTIMDFDGHPIFSIHDNKKINENSIKIIIEDNVWIGMNSTILKGVTLGKGSIIGANSVVTKNVLPNTLVAGNPAKKIKENIRWEIF